MLQTCFLILAATAATTFAGKTFLGSIPMQYVAPGQGIVLVPQPA